MTDGERESCGLYKRESQRLIVEAVVVVVEVEAVGVTTAPTAPFGSHVRTSSQPPSAVPPLLPLLLQGP